MNGGHIARPASGPALPPWLGTLLFMAMSLFLLVSITPYFDLTGEAVLDPSAGKSNRLNQIVTLTITAGFLAWGAAHPMRGIILQPRALLAVLFLWFLTVSLVSAHPMLGIKDVVLAVLTIANAGIYLLLPSSERHFARMLAWSMLVMLAFAYFGVVFKPTLSIHQASELREPMNAGFWRGHFPHKNAAAAAMALAIFFGLYVMRAWSRAAGLVIVVLALFFLINTGGKTSSAMVPFILVLAFLFEKMRPLRAAMVIGGVASFNILAVGTAVWPTLGRFISDLGIDATFTNRTDIWRLAFEAFAERPFTGYGPRAFWQTEELVHGGGAVETWAVAATSGHNSYLDIALSTGIPGLVMALCFVLVLPLRDIGRIAPQDQHSPLTRLFVRIWLYALFHAVLESFFFVGGNIIWFMLVVALTGLRLQSRAVLETGARRRGVTAAAHA
ncbi:MAG TPA: O-antigen ligase [Aquamicrobium sp.]|nr:O-antigen ligase [Aquamicrobium sp.]